jgi:hypothetical protein
VRFAEAGVSEVVLPWAGEVLSIVVVMMLLAAIVPSSVFGPSGRWCCGIVQVVLLARYGDPDRLV